jgi:hypothetical protein
VPSLECDQGAPFTEVTSTCLTNAQHDHIPSLYLGHLQALGGRRLVPGVAVLTDHLFNTLPELMGLILHLNFSSLFPTGLVERTCWQETQATPPLCRWDWMFTHHGNRCFPNCLVGHGVQVHFRTALWENVAKGNTIYKYFTSSGRLEQILAPPHMTNLMMTSTP